MSEARVMYQRTLPGGGFVQVEEETGEVAFHRAHVAVERRSDPARRYGHTPPIIAVAEDPSARHVFRQLMEVARDNVSIARALLRWRSNGLAKF